MSFEQWIVDGHALGWPTLDDLAYHVTTLFPPVRPRGWLELRMIDALPEQWWPVAVAVTVALLDDPLAAEWATVGDRARVRDRWSTAARDALHDPALGDAARWCFDAARSRSSGWAPTTRPSTPPRSTSTASSAEPAAPPTSCSTSGPDAPSLPV